MNLPFLNKFNKKNPAAYFLVLVLRSEKASAVIFQEQDGKVREIGRKEEYFEHSVETAPVEEFLDVLDKAITGAESVLPPDIETKKTIFGIREDWAQDNQIKKEYLVKLKKASDELGLTPIGFLVITQAISHLLQKEEGAPISAILVDAGKTYVTITLVRAGRIIESKTSEIHENIPFTVDTLLKHFEAAEILPSRIIIFNGEEDLSQEFISHTWSKSLPFLHLPQITSLPSGTPAKSVLFGAATQMGFEVLDEMPKAQADKELPVTKKETPKPEQQIFEPQPSFENFGFLKDEDVAKIKPKLTPQLPIETTDQFPDKLELPKKIIDFIFSFYSIKVAKFLPGSLKSRGKIVFGIAAVLVLILGVYLFYLLGTKATVVLNITPKILEKDKTVSFSTTSSTDPQKNIIGAQPISVSEDGNISTPATGTKDVGTSAKGTVTIFNSLSANKTLSQGTTIKSPNGLKFSIDQSVTISAVASHSADETVPPSTKTVSVTAVAIGKESNLPSGTKFTIASFDIADIAAKNDNPFSGGTKKEVTVVSKNDIDKLKKDLPKNLETKAKEDLLKKIASDKILLPAFINVTLKDVDANSVNQETKQATLKATVFYEGITYDKKDLASLSSAFLQNDIAQDLKLDTNNLKVDVKDITQKKNEDISANLTIKAILLPIIEEEKLKKQIKGKPSNQAQDQLLKLPEVTSVYISYSPNIPFFPKKIPSISNHIKITTHINE